MKEKRTDWFYCISVYFYRKSNFSLSLKVTSSRWWTRNQHLRQEIRFSRKYRVPKQQRKANGWVTNKQEISGSQKVDGSGLKKETSQGAAAWSTFGQEWNSKEDSGTEMAEVRIRA